MPYYTGPLDGHRELFNAIVAALTNVANGADQWSVVPNSTFRGVANTSASSNISVTPLGMDLSSITYWVTAPGTPATDIFYRWEHFDLTQLTELRIQAVANPNIVNAMPTDFELQYSDDLISWFAVPVNETTTGLSWSASEVKRFVVTGSPGAHRHWRIYINANGGSLSTVIGSLFPYDASGIFIGTPGEQTILKAPFSSEGNFALVKLTLGSSRDSNWFNIGLQSGVSIENLTYDIGNSETLTYASFVNPSPVTYFPSVDAVGVNNISYWLAVNGRRFACATKADTVYTGCYGGLFLPYGTLTQYPYPMVVGEASGVETVSIQDVDVQTRTFIDPGQGSLQVYRPDNTWWAYSNQAFDRNVWPFDEVSQILDEPETFLAGHTSIGTIAAAPAYPMFPCILHESNPQNNALGELEGVFGVSGFNNTSENIIDVGGVDHLVVQDLFRTDVGNYWAMKLE